MPSMYLPCSIQFFNLNQYKTQGDISAIGLFLPFIIHWPTKNIKLEIISKKKNAIAMIT